MTNYLRHSPARTKIASGLKLCAYAPARRCTAAALSERRPASASASEASSCAGAKVTKRVSSSSSMACACSETTMPPALSRGAKRNVSAAPLLAAGPPLPPFVPRRLLLSAHSLWTERKMPYCAIFCSQLASLCSLSVLASGHAAVECSARAAPSAAAHWYRGRPACLAEPATTRNPAPLASSCWIESRHRRRDA